MGNLKPSTPCRPKALDFDVNPSTNCWEVVSHKPSSKGYTRLYIGGEMVQTHRFVYESFYGEIPEGLFICHTCDNRVCINPEHLFLGTLQDNVSDMVAKDRQAKGSNIANSKYSEDQIKDIKYGAAPVKELMNKYGMSKANICKIRQGKLWVHI
jgi:hypothetical protein